MWKDPNHKKWAGEVNGGGFQILYEDLNKT